MIVTTFKDRALGCLLGVAVGDALGAPFEGGLLERLLWKLLGRSGDGRQRWTDDTQMTLNVMESLHSCGELDQDHLAQVFARDYRWRRGYGPSAAKLLNGIRKGRHWSTLNTARFPQGSYGNGAAMRVAPLAVYYHDDEDALLSAVECSALITHAHHHAIHGAQLIAMLMQRLVTQTIEEPILKTALILVGDEDYGELLEQAIELGSTASPQTVATTLGNGIAAIESCVTTVYVAQRFQGQDLEELLTFVRQMGGDVDTIGAMSAALWGAQHGLSAIPTKLLEQVEASEYIQQRAQDFLKSIQQ